MPKTSALAAALASMLALAAAPAFSQTTGGATQPAPVAKTMPAKGADSGFVHDAALGGMTEVKLSQLALSNGDSQAVKDFAQKMVDDHGKANDELAGIASGKGMTPPATLDATHQKLVDKFGAMKGAAFDKAYWKQMSTDHKKTVALFQKEAKSGQDADIKGFAAKTLPTIQMHLKMVQDAMAGSKAAMNGAPAGHG
jgi:putative membrane protein